MIAETRRKEQRNRLLPARLVAYYVIALALFFGEAYEEVMRKLIGGLRSLPASGWGRRRCGGCSSRPQLPLATPATIGAWLGNWRVMAVDGVTLDVPDTDDNEAAFGRDG